MTRGPVPARAIRKAMKAAEERGTVLDPCLAMLTRLAFIVFGAGITIFVRVRRIRHRLIDPEECAFEFRSEVLQLRRIPLTNVTARELWLLSPWGTWQYFRVHDDRLVEIRSSGAPLLQEEDVPAIPPAGVRSGPASPV